MVVYRPIEVHNATYKTNLWA